MYEKTAEYYDLSMKEDYDYDKWSQFILSVISQSNVYGIDLGCGTGNITYRLSKCGKRVIGVDSSSEMLTIAQKKTYCGKRPIFILADIISFKPLEKPQFVTAVCDVINYIPFADVGKLFKKIYNYLGEGGEFIFDITTPEKFDKMVNDAVYFTDREEYTRLWTVERKAQRIEENLIYFLPLSNGSYERFDEKHTMFIYEVQQVIDELCKVGFSAECFGSLEKAEVTGQEERVYFKAVKR